MQGSFTGMKWDMGHCNTVFEVFVLHFSQSNHSKRRSVRTFPSIVDTVIIEIGA